MKEFKAKVESFDGTTQTIVLNIDGPFDLGGWFVPVSTTVSMELDVSSVAYDQKQLKPGVLVRVLGATFKTELKTGTSIDLWFPISIRVVK